MCFFRYRSSSKNDSLTRHFDITAFPVHGFYKMCVRPANKKKANLEKLTCLYVINICQSAICQSAACLRQEHFVLEAWYLKALHARLFII